MTLRKMYLVLAEQYEHNRPQPQPSIQLPPPPPVTTRPSVKTKRVAKKMKKNGTHHPHNKRVALRTKLLEADIKETDLIHRFADFLRKVLPQSKLQMAPQQHPLTETRRKFEMLDIAETPQRSPIAQQTEPPSVCDASTIYEILKRRLISSGGNDGETSYGDDLRGAYEVSSPYPSKLRFLTNSTISDETAIRL